ncbi:MAG: hypothetical protein BWY74_04436 [Firmicutes bacterium ADurb.Bin419]|nr:MAG: hypothetical protein BWY74_04436 [Firmicutes bacterium ADurb.Bin419]
MPTFFPVPRKVPIVSKVSERLKASTVLKTSNILVGSANSPAISSLNRVGAIDGGRKSFKLIFGIFVTFPINSPRIVVDNIPIRIDPLTFLSIKTTVIIRPISASCETGSVKFTISGTISFAITFPPGKVAVIL